MIRVDTKICTRCSVEKPCTRDYFSLSKTGRLGFASACKNCQREIYSVSAKSDPEKFRDYARKSYCKNSGKIKERVRKKKHTDKSYALRLRVSSLVRQSLGKGRLGQSWMKLLEFSPGELHARLESLFTEGMSWESFYNGEIEIDHVIPVSFFRPSDPDSLEFRMCWSLNNLQPLWRGENRAKGDRLPNNFPEVWNQLYLEATS